MTLLLLIILSISSAKIKTPTNFDSILIKWCTYGFFLTFLFMLFYLFNLIYLCKARDLPDTYFPRILVIVILIKLTYYGWAIYGFVVEK